MLVHVLLECRPVFYVKDAEFGRWSRRGSNSLCPIIRLANQVELGASSR